MPDVSTDTFGPGAGPTLASAGWLQVFDDTLKRKGWLKPSGDETYADRMYLHNALVAAITSMSEVEQQQAEDAAGVTVQSLPESIFPATADSRWTGGLQYAPENQTPGILADPCGQAIDLPALTPPVLAGANTGTGTLASGTYRYKVTALNANGESLPSNEVSVAVTGGAATLTITLYGYANMSAINVYRTAAAGGANSEHLLSTGTGVAPTGPVTGGASQAVTFVDNGSGSLSGSVVPPSSDTTVGPGDYTNLPMVQYVPFLVQVEDECSAFGWSERDYVGRALRLLDNATPNAIEREFWGGGFARNTLTGPMVGSNAFLTQSATNTGGGTGLGAVDLTPGSSGSSPSSITRGIQILEDYLANNGFGGQGMLHVAPETSPNLLGARRVGSLLLSVMDNIIVPGSGYPTSGNTGPIDNANPNPGAGNAWICATDLVSVRLDSPFIWPTTLAEALDRGAGGQPNTIRFRAQRFAAATFDLSRLAACRVVLST
jgi:hypothetical protein